MVMRQDSSKDGGSDPLIDAQNALQSAIDAEIALNNFANLIEETTEQGLR